MRCELAYHESEGITVECAPAGVIDALSPGPQLDQPHHGCKPAVNSCKVSHDRGIEDCIAVADSNVTVDACSVPYLACCGATVRIAHTVSKMSQSHMHACIVS